MYLQCNKSVYCIGKHVLLQCISSAILTPLFCFSGENYIQIYKGAGNSDLLSILLKLKSVLSVGKKLKLDVVIATIIGIISSKYLHVIKRNLFSTRIAIQASDVAILTFVHTKNM